MSALIAIIRGPSPRKPPKKSDYYCRAEEITRRSSYNDRMFESDSLQEVKLEVVLASLSIFRRETMPPIKPEVKRYLFKLNTTSYLVIVFFGVIS